MLPALIETASRMPIDRLHQFGHDLRPLLRLAYRPEVVARNLAYAFPGRDAEALTEWVLHRIPRRFAWRCSGRCPCRPRSCASG